MSQEHENQKKKRRADGKKIAAAAAPLIVAGGVTAAYNVLYRKITVKAHYVKDGRELTGIPVTLSDASGKTVVSGTTGFSAKGRRRRSFTVNIANQVPKTFATGDGQTLVFDHWENNDSDTPTYVIDTLLNNTTLNAMFDDGTGNVPGDTTPPLSFIASISDGNGQPVTQGGATTSTTLNAMLSGSDDVSSTGNLRFQAKLDNGAYQDTTSPITLTGLSVGPHTLSVVAIDEAGNVDPTPAVFTWTVLPPPDTVPPETTITIVKDITGATVPNGGSTTSTSITITFTGSDDVNIARFEAAVDSGSYQPVTSPFSVLNSSVGAHVVKIRAVDTSGNVDPTPAQFNWTVLTPPDTTPPDTALTSVNDSAGASIPEAGTTSSTSAKFTFTGVDNVGIARFEGALDTAAFATITSPYTVTGLALGQHQMKIRAIDTSGNVDPSPVVFSWTVVTPPDTTNPDTTISSVKDGTGATIANNGSTASTSLAITFTGTDNLAVSRYEAALDTQPYVTVTSPFNITNLALGAHVVKIRAVDAAGNVDPTPAQFNWTVVLPPDTTAPETTITSLKDATGATIAPNGSTSSTSVTVTFTGSDDIAVARFEASLDTQAFVTVTSPFTVNNLTIGSHTLRVRAVDTSGNVDATPGSITWSVTDGVPPTLTVTSIKDGTGATLAAGAQTTSQSATFTFTGTDNVAVVGFQIAVDNNLFSPASSPYTVSAGQGPHTVRILSFDGAGNQSNIFTFSWTVVVPPDTTAPDTSIDSVKDGVGATIAPNGSTGSNAVTVTFSGSDNVAIDHFEVAFDSTTNFVTRVSPYTINNINLGNHTVRVRAVDTSGNVDPSPATFSWTVIDTIPPDTTITSAKDGAGATIGAGGTTSNSATFVFTASDNVAVKQVNIQLDTSPSVVATSPYTVSNLALGTHTIKFTAVDTANNVDPTPATFTWTVNTPPDTTPPVANIVSAVDGNNASLQSGGSTTSKTLVITYSATDNVAVTKVEASLDSGTFTDVTSAPNQQVTLSNLTVASHSVRIRATDAAGNSNTATFNWTVNPPPVDTTRPNVAILTPTNGQGGFTTAPANISVTGTCSDPESGVTVVEVAYNHSVTGRSIYQQATLNQSKTSWSLVLQNIPAGQVEIWAHAVNAAGLEAWTNTTYGQTVIIQVGQVIDTTPPDTALTGVKDGTGATIAAGGTTTSTSATFTFAGSDNIAVARFEFSLDNNPTWTAVPGGASATSLTVTGLSVSGHNMRIRSVDTSGGVDATPVSFSWTVVNPPDTTPPDTTITSVKDGSGATLANGGSTTSTSLTVNFTGSDNISIASFQYSLDNNANWTTIAGGAAVSSVNFSGFGVGSHNVRIRAVDTSGNPDATPASWSWTVNTIQDTVPPTISIIALKDSAGNNIPAGGSTQDTSFVVTFNASDNVGVTKVEGSVNNAAFTVVNNTGTVNLTGFSPGSQNFRMRATDAAGNVSAIASISWTITSPVDTTAPDTQLTSVKDGAGATLAAGGSTTSTSAVFTFTGTDNVAVARFEAKLDSGNFQTVTSPFTASSLTVGAHTVQLRAIDTSGNADASPVSFSWNVTSSGGGGGNTDAFGMTNIYPTATSGSLQAWDATKLFAVNHTIPTGSQNTSSDSITFTVDNVDPWMDCSHGDLGSGYAISGNKLTSNVDIARIYVHNPDHSKQWNENMEITFTYQETGTRSKPSDEFWYSQIFARTNHGCDYREDHGNDGEKGPYICSDRGYGLSLDDGGSTISIEKEICHHCGDNGYIRKGSGTLSGSAPFYIKYILRNNVANTETTIEVWQSTDQGKTWQKKLSVLDDGKSWSTSGIPCNTGVSPTTRFTEALVTPDNMAGRPAFPAVYWRSEYLKVTWDKMSIRPIQPY
nr:hypothetical protein [uncultured Nitrososphaera sp.]